MSESSDRNDREWESRADKAYDRFTKRPVWTSVKYILILTLAVVALGALGKTVGFFGGWASQPARIYGVDNVRKTWSEAYKLDRDTTAQARIICSTAQSSDLAGTVSGSALLASTTTYQRIWSSYSQLVSNKLEGGLVLPRDLPNRDTTLGKMLVRVNCPKDVIATIPGGLLK